MNQPSSSLPELPQLLLVRTQAHRDTESERPGLARAVLELDRAAFDGDANVAKVAVREATLPVRQEGAKVTRQSDRRGRAPRVIARADLRVQPRIRRGEARLDCLGRGRITAVRLRIRGRDQCHHLRIQQRAQRALRECPEATIEHQHHDAEEQRERQGNGNQQSPAERVHGAGRAPRSPRRARARTDSRVRAASRSAAAPRPDRACGANARSRPR